jgi:hypothetical protein
MFSVLSSNTLSDAYPSQAIPAKPLGYGTNTRFPSFPPLMKDGRSIVSSWQPEAVLNDRIIQENNIRSNWEYRRYLTKNAKQLIESNAQEAANDTGFTILTSEYLAGTPYKYSSLEDNRPVLGVEPSDLKQLYLSREQLDSRKIAPAITQAELIHQFGIGVNP